MLILTRKPGQAVQIADDIVVLIKSVRFQRVSIAIQAPADVRIVRAELQPRESDTTLPHKAALP